MQCLRTTIPNKRNIRKAVSVSNDMKCRDYVVKVRLASAIFPNIKPDQTIIEIYSTVTCHVHNDNSVTFQSE